LVIAHVRAQRTDYNMHNEIKFAWSRPSRAQIQVWHAVTEAALRLLPKIPLIGLICMNQEAYRHHRAWKWPAE
jgi:hypothetical protein